MIKIIVAVAPNNVIGKENKIPWHLPSDLANFKRKTMGQTIIMGRKTFESISVKLKNRTIIVLSKDMDYQPKGILVANSKDEAINLAPKDQDIFIAGGENVYKEFLEEAEEIQMTNIYQEFEGDTFFPALSKEWHIFDESKGLKDQRTGVEYSVTIYRKERL